MSTPRPRALLLIAATSVLAVALSLLAVGGDDLLGPAAAVRAVFGHGDPAQVFVVRELRLPRVVTALAVGAALSLAGALLQSLTRNPLGSPDILGITQGAATGALIAVVTGAGSGTLAAGATIGGALTGVLILTLAGRGANGTGARHDTGLVLVGIGVCAVLSGVNGYLLTRGQLTDAARAMLWLTGSLDGRGWSDVAPVGIALVVLVPALAITRRPLALLEMGAPVATGLGVRVALVRLVTLAAAVLLASLAAAAAGPVAFVALVAPQLARRLSRTPGPGLLASTTTGAALMVGADLIAQRALSDRQLPVGVVTGLLGGGYLVWLLAARTTGRTR